MSWRSKSYDPLPALSIRGPQLRSALRTVTIAWMFGVTWMALVQGSRVIYFGRMLGFSDLHFGLLSGAPFLATLGQFLAVLLIERTGLRKYQFVYCGTAHRLLWLGVAVIPLLLPIPSRAAVWAMLAIVTLSWFLAALGEPAWFTWMGDMIPRRIRGRYMASRSIRARLVQIPLIILLGVFLDSVTARDPATGEVLAMTAIDQPLLLWTICGIFAVAAILGAVDTLAFYRIREIMPSTDNELRKSSITLGVSRPASQSPVALAGYAWRLTRGATSQLLIDPMRDKGFRRVAFYGAAITFSASVSAPYYWRNMLENLGFSQFATDSQFLIFGPLFGMLSAGGWGRLIDRWGRRPVLMLSTICIVFAVIPHLLITRHTPAPQFVLDAGNWLSSTVGGWLGYDNLQWLTPDMPVGAWLAALGALALGGSGWIGLMLTQTGIILGFSDGRSGGGSKYVAARAVMISVGGILGGVVGGLVTRHLDWLQENPIIMGPVLWNNWHITFLLTMASRIVAIVCIIGMPDPGAGRFRDMTRHLGVNAYNFMSTRMFYRLRTLGWPKRNRHNGRPH